MSLVRYMRKKVKKKLKKKLHITQVLELGKFGLRLPSDGLFDEGKLLGQCEFDIVGKHMENAKPPTAHINEMFVATEKQFSDQTRISQLREQIISDYTGSVFCEKLPTNPPNRGRYGVAFIPLKDNAQPTWSRPFPMQGEKEIAYKKLFRTGLTKIWLNAPQKKVSNGVALVLLSQKSRSLFLGGGWWMFVDQTHSPVNAIIHSPSLRRCWCVGGGSYLLEN